MEIFQKLLVGKFSLKNGCHANDGEILTLIPRKEIPKNKDVAHYFVSVRDSGIKSKYGWVEEAKPFTIEDFIRTQLSAREIGEQEMEHIRIMLSSIQKLVPGTPVTPSYVVRGVIEKRTDLIVHKVFFYHPKD
ncbi:MAG TPA: hypothetical protein VG122_07645 [Gemmata sp.]|jgi:hypothetical protein|nr:hypothetical protein [Gemmata sp.]